MMNEQQEIKYAQSIRNQRVDMFQKVARGLEELDLTDSATRKLYLSSVEPRNKNALWYYEIHNFINKKSSNSTVTRQKGVTTVSDQVVPQQPPPSQQTMNSYQNPPHCPVVENPGFQQQPPEGVYMGNEQQYGQQMQPQYAPGLQHYTQGANQGFFQGGQGLMANPMPNPLVYPVVFANPIQQKPPPQRTTYYLPPSVAQYYGNLSHTVHPQHNPSGPVSYEMAGPTFNVPPPTHIPQTTQNSNSWSANYAVQQENEYSSQQNNPENFQPDNSESNLEQLEMVNQQCQPIELVQVVESVETQQKQQEVSRIVAKLIMEKEKKKAQEHLSAKPANEVGKVTATEKKNFVPDSVVFPALPTLKTSSKLESAVKPTLPSPPRTVEFSYAEKASKKPISEFHYTEEPTAPLEQKPIAVQQDDPWKVSELWTPRNSKNGGGRNYNNRQQNKSDYRRSNKKNYQKPPPKPTEPIATKEEPVVVKPVTFSNPNFVSDVADAPPKPIVPSAPPRESSKSTDSSQSSSIAEEVDIPKFEDAMEDLKGLDLSPISPTPSSCYSSVGSQPDQKPKSVSKSGGNKKKTGPKAPPRKSKEELKAEDDFLNELIAANEIIKSRQAVVDAKENIIKKAKEEREKKEREALEAKMEKEREWRQKRQEMFEQHKQLKLGELQKIGEALMNEMQFDIIDDEDTLPEEGQVITFTFKGTAATAAMCAKLIQGMRRYQIKLMSEKNKVFTKEEIEKLPKFQRSVVEANVFSARTQLEKEILMRFMIMRQEVHKDSPVPGDHLRQMLYVAIGKHFVPCVYPSILHLLNNDDDRKTLDQLEGDFCRMLLELRSEE